MIYELRIYEVNNDKMENLQKRFQEYTLKFFEKHGITPISFYVADNDKQLVYILKFDSVEKRNLAWEKFLNDPEWIEVSNKTNMDGRIVANIQSYILHSIDLKLL